MTIIVRKLTDGHIMEEKKKYIMCLYTHTHIHTHSLTHKHTHTDYKKRWLQKTIDVTPFKSIKLSVQFAVVMWRTSCVSDCRRQRRRTQRPCHGNMASLKSRSMVRH